MLNIVLFGPPGAGKGTQAEKLVSKYKLYHISTGDVFRRNMQEQTSLGNLARQYIDEGKLVPDAVTIDMLSAEMDRAGRVNGFILDGFPRTVAQAVSLDNMLSGRNTSVSVMISLEVSDDELKKRLSGRASVSGRADDSDPAIIENRIAVYKEQTLPVFGYYKKQGKTKTIEGLGSIDEIFDRICRAVEN
jgi:adenylate kinase